MAWRIEIRGDGSHHSADNENDANKLAKAFVQALIAAGHTVKLAEFEISATHLENLVETQYSGKTPLLTQSLDTPIIEIGAIEGL